MNRNEVYEIINEVLFNYKVLVNGRPYNKFYVGRDWTWSVIQVNNSFINDFNELYICTDELVIRGKYDSIQINIPYKDIDLLFVDGGEE